MNKEKEEAKKNLSRCFGFLSDERLSNLVYHAKRDREILCGEHAMATVSSSGHASPEVLSVTRDVPMGKDSTGGILPEWESALEEMAPDGSGYLLALRKVNSDEVKEIIKKVAKERGVRA